MAATATVESGETLEGILAALRARRGDLASRFNVRRLAVFGSVVRGEQRRDSDVDVLVEFDTAPSLFTFVALESELSAAVGRRVDLVDRSVLRPKIGECVLREAVPV